MKIIVHFLLWGVFICGLGAIPLTLITLSGLLLIALGLSEGEYLALIQSLKLFIFGVCSFFLGVYNDRVWSNYTAIVSDLYGGPKRCRSKKS